MPKSSYRGSPDATPHEADGGRAKLLESTRTVWRGGHLDVSRARVTYHFVTQSQPTPAQEGSEETPPTGPAGLHGEAEPGAPAREAREARERKERVLHTRVPAVLERELKRFADNLRVPVSNLVRTILEDAMSVADAAGESVEARLRKAATHLERERERLRRRIEQDALEGVVAFQEVTLAVATTCATCGVDLAKGAQAYLGVREEAGGPRVFVCGPCHLKA